MKTRRPTPNDMPKTLNPELYFELNGRYPEHDCDEHDDGVHCMVCGERLSCCDDH